MANSCFSRPRPSSREPVLLIDEPVFSYWYPKGSYRPEHLDRSAVNQEEAKAARYQSEVEEMMRKAREHAGVAEAMEVYRNAERVMAQARPYLQAMRTRVVYTTSSGSG